MMRFVAVLSGGRVFVSSIRTLNFCLACRDGNRLLVRIGIQACT